MKLWRDNLEHNNSLALRKFHSLLRLKGQVNGKQTFHPASLLNKWEAFRLTLSNFSLQNVQKFKNHLQSLRDDSCLENYLGANWHQPFGRNVLKGVSNF